MPSINQIEQTKPLKKKSEYSRTLFENGTKTEKYWCYQKNTINQYGNPEKQGYFCHNCKNELFFRWNNNPPFRVHGAFLERKEKVNEYGNEVNISYLKALCCKCWDKWVGDPNQIKEFEGGKLTMLLNKCDCQEFINGKVKEAAESIKNYDSMIRDCNDLLKDLEKIKSNAIIFNSSTSQFEDNDFKVRRLNDFIRDLQKRQKDAEEGKEKQEQHLILYKNWEIIRNNQLRNE